MGRNKIAKQNSKGTPARKHNEKHNEGRRLEQPERRPTEEVEEQW